MPKLQSVVQFFLELGVEILPIGLELVCTNSPQRTVSMLTKLGLSPSN